jgi:hypothetical protein
MVKIYVDLIKRGLKRLNDVPERWRAEVETALAAEDVRKG